MARLEKEDYRNAVEILRKYNYNCINIINIRADIMSISISQNIGMPKVPYSIPDTVFNQYIKLEENKQLQKSLKEYKAVMQTLELVCNDSKYIFEKLYVKNKSKWEIIDEMHISEETFKRRKRELIYTVYEEMKKMT